MSDPVDPPSDGSRLASDGSRLASEGARPASEAAPPASEGSTSAERSQASSGGSPAADARELDGRWLWSRLSAAVAEAVVGADEPLRLLATALLADGHALIEDVPGVGKTLLARAFSRALGLDTARVQGTPDLLPVDVTGGSIIENGVLRFVPGPVFTNVLLVDEINRATPRTQSALLEAMQERQVSIEGAVRPLPEPFLLLATQNPIEYEGTFTLPEAQLDRFLVRLRVGYPDADAERRIARRHLAEREPLDRVPCVVDAAAILMLREKVRTTHVSEEVESYVTSLVRATRSHPDLSLGASPRASVALFRASQAWAFLEGRSFVRPDDVKAVAPAVLGHRLIVDLDRGLGGATGGQIVAAILDAVPAPPIADAVPQR